MSRSVLSRRAERRWWHAVLRRWVARLMREAVESNEAGLRDAILRGVRDAGRWPAAGWPPDERVG